MKRFLVSAAAVLGGAATAHANVEVGGTAGIHVFATDNEVAFPGNATVKNYPPGAMQFHAPPPPPARPPIAVNTTSRIIFSDVLPLPY